MPRGTLSFNLPEEQEEWQDALNGTNHSIVLQELDNYLRGVIKYQDLPEDKAAIYQEIRDKLWQLRQDRSWY